MPRPRRCRFVDAYPDITYFKPQGVPLRTLEEAPLSFDELEALRLKDLEGLDQSEAAVKMGTSQPTFHRLVLAARKNVADALVHGKAVKIGGGNVQMRGRGLRKR